MRNPPVLYHYYSDKDNEEQSRDHLEQIEFETVIPSSSYYLRKNEDDMESSVNSEAIVCERRFYF